MRVLAGGPLCLMIDTRIRERAAPIRRFSRSTSVTASTVPTPAGWAPFSTESWRLVAATARESEVEGVAEAEQKGQPDDRAHDRRHGSDDDGGWSAADRVSAGKSTVVIRRHRHGRRPA